jgi:hypothetical protein
MDVGEIVLISSRLALGAVSSFLAIVLWSKTRDVAWMLIVVATIAAYAETVYAILDRFGLTEGVQLAIGSVPLASIIMPNLPTLLYIVAFAVMVARKSGARLR